MTNGGAMPPITIFNLRRQDPLPAIEEALRDAIKTVPALEIHDDEVDFIPVRAPDDFRAAAARIYMDPWEGPARTKDGLQHLATRMAMAFQSVVGQDRKVKVVIRPYDLEKSGWASL
jgi:hypothetical protein